MENIYSSNTWLLKQGLTGTFGLEEGRPFTKHRLIQDAQEVKSHLT